RELIGRGELQTDAGCRLRIGRTAAGQVLSGKHRPAERRVEKKVGVVADQKFLRRGELPETQADLAAEFLLDPKIEQPGRGWRLDAADRHEIVEVGGAKLRAVNLMNAGVKRGAGPAPKLVEIGVDDGAEPALLAEPLLHAADRVGKCVAVVGEGEFQPIL